MKLCVILLLLKILFLTEICRCNFVNYSKIYCYLLFKIIAVLFERLFYLKTEKIYSPLFHYMYNLCNCMH